MIGKSHCRLCAWLIVVFALSPSALRGQDVVPPRSVKVLPVFLVPKGEVEPTIEQANKLMRHLEWSQSRYRELLNNQITFAFVETKPRVYRSKRDLAFYRKQSEGGAPEMVSELLVDLNTNRYSCPYVFLILVMNPKDDFPIGGGRPLNGGINTGGGVVQLSTFALDRIPNFQSTLQHELGHAFGLTHVDAYGYDMASNNSMMSYNPKHHTKEFLPSDSQAVLIAEDRRALALNQRVFPNLQYVPIRDLPPHYSLAKRIEVLGPMKITGQPDGLIITTESGEEHGSKVANIAQGKIGQNINDGTVTFDATTMWHSGKAKSEWVTAQIEFPYEVDLSGVAVHSQHSGTYHVARGVRVSVRRSATEFKQITEANLKSSDDTVIFPKTKSRVWRFEFSAGESQYIVLRGLQFFSGTEELFPPLIPYHQ